jgi:hypothetical protein
MPVLTIPVTSELVLVMDNGIGTSGQQLKKNRIYKYLKTSAENEDVFFRSPEPVRSAGKDQSIHPAQ